jgi:hypothetical protein
MERAPTATTMPRVFVSLVVTGREGEGSERGAYRYAGRYIFFSMNLRTSFGLFTPARPLRKIASAIVTATLTETSRMSFTGG